MLFCQFADPGDTQVVAAAGFRTEDPGMASIGKKVQAWYQDGKAEGFDPKTRRATAKLLGVSINTVRGWEEGSQPNARTAAKIAVEMGVTLEWLTDPTQPARPRPEGTEASAVIDAEGVALGRAIMAELSEAERETVLAAIRDPDLRDSMIAFVESLRARKRLR